MGIDLSKAKVFELDGENLQIEDVYMLARSSAGEFHLKIKDNMYL